MRVRWGRRVPLDSVSHSPETLHPRADSEALVGQVGNLRPVGNRPVPVERTAPSSTVSGPRDAPEGIVFRSWGRDLWVIGPSLWSVQPLRPRFPAQETLPKGSSFARVNATCLTPSE